MAFSIVEQEILEVHVSKDLQSGLGVMLGYLMVKATVTAIGRNKLLVYTQTGENLKEIRMNENIGHQLYYMIPLIDYS